MSVTQFGDPGIAIDRGEIEQRVLIHVSTWIDSYLANLELKKNLGQPPLIARPARYDVVTEFTELPEDTLPFVAVISTGTSPGQSPRIDGEGDITAWWMIAIGVLAEAAMQQDAKSVVGYYGAVLRQLMVQMPELGGYAQQEPWAAGVMLNDERYDDWKRADNQFMAAVRMVFTVEVPNVVNIYNGFRAIGGGFAVPEDPYHVQPDYPPITVKDTDIAVAKPDQPLSEAED